MKIITNEFKYDKELKANNTITVTVGNGQKGVITIIKQNDETFTKEGIIKDYLIGSNSELKNKIVVISSVITDIREDTDVTTLSIDINGQNFKVLTDTTEHNHALISYQTVIKF
jgi:hypothetical protein